MLVISRTVGSSFTIGDDVEVYILKLDRGEVRIGITAPPDVVIMRDDAVDVKRERKPS